MNKLLRLVFCSALVFCTRQAIAQKQIPKGSLDSLIAEQRFIVSTLSGETSTDQRVTLKRRWTNNEKKIVRRFLTSSLASTGFTTKEAEYSVNLSHVKPSRNPLQGTNLFLTIPASIQSADYLIFGAHYDTVKESPGAMDNATGCALIHSLAKMIAKMPVRKMNVIIVFFDQEELGHAGSYAFADFIKDRGFSVHSVHTFDMIGWDEDGDRNIELELPTAELKSLYMKHAKAFGIDAYETETSETDHREFRAVGFNSVGIGGEYKHGDTSPHHHLPTDKVSTVDFGYLAFVTLLVYEVTSDLLLK